MRKLVVLGLVGALVLAACGGTNATTVPKTGAAGSPGASQAALSGTNCSDWCGTGSAKITIGATTTTITGGACLVEGDAVDARFGDWWAVPHAAGELVLLGYLSGGTKPTISGTAGTTLFVLGDDAVATVAADGSGSFSGSNSVGPDKVSGTWTCK
jgi:hypothetical protein